MSHTFCRSLKTGIFKEVQKHVPVNVRKKTFVWKSFNNYEFHILAHDKCPDGYYQVYRGCCKWYAAFQGWCDYLSHIGVEVEEMNEDKLMEKQ